MKRKYMQALSLLLALMLLLTGCAAANNGAAEDQTTAATQNSVTQAPDQVTVDPNGAVGEGEITFFSMNMNRTADEYLYLMAYPNEDGTVYAEFVGEVKKIGEAMDGAVLEQIARAVEQAALIDLNGQNVYEEGEAGGSVYIEYSDGTVIGAGFSGVLPQVFLDAYSALEDCFRTVMADLDVYVPEPLIAGEVNADVLAEVLKILQDSGMANLDAFMISDVALDDSFAYMMGLSSMDGIVSGTSCSAVMITTPYALSVVTVEDEGNVADVQADFLEHLDWTKWVCVMPTDAMVARKGNMVLCLMGADDMYNQTASAIAANGWTDVQEESFPGA